MNILFKYKSPILIAMVIAMDIIAVKSQANLQVGLLIFLVSILAIFVLDFDLFIYKNFLQDKTNTSGSSKLTFKEYLKDLDNPENYKLDLIMHNAMFQVMIIFLSIYVVAVHGNVLAQAFMLSLYSNIIFRQLSEYNVHSNIERWFSFYTGKKDKTFYLVYFCTIVLILIYLLIFI